MLPAHWRRPAGFNKQAAVMSAFDDMERKVVSMEDRNNASAQLRDEGDIDSAQEPAETRPR
jgi:phage shock protein A